MKSIAARTTIAIGLLAVAAFGIAAWLSVRNATQVQSESATAQISALAEAQAYRIRLAMESTLAKVRGLAETAEAEMAQPRPDRFYLHDLLRRYTERDTTALGYWLEFERNAFDGRDAEFVGNNVVAISTIGRFTGYWVRNDDGSVTAEVGGETEDIGAEDYYASARDLGGETMFEPYPYDVSGVEVLMTSLMVPIFRDGEFRGVAGADVALAGLQEQLAAVRPYGSGVLRLYSPTGMLMAGPEADQLGKPGVHPRMAEILAAAAKGESLLIEAEDAAAGGAAMQYFMPFRVGADDPRHFVLSVSAPVAVVFEGVTSIRNRVLLIGALSAIGLALAVRFILVLLVRRPLAQTVVDVSALAEGKLDHPIAGRGEDEVGQVAGALRRMQRDLGARIEEERRVAAVNHRVRRALDGAAAGVMIADADGTVVYVNEAAQRSLAGMAAAVRAAVPGFDPTAPEGQSLRALYPGIDEVAASGEVRIVPLRFGESHVQLALAALRDDRGRVAGLVANWTDRSDEVRTEQEVNALVGAASEGRLDGRIALAGKSGFFLQLGTALNRLLDASASGIAEVQAVLAALADGDLTVRSQAPLHGVFAQMRDDANATADALEDVLAQIKLAVGQIHTASAEIAAGNQDLSVRTEQQAANLEETAASVEELTASVRENADSARAGREVAAQAADVSGRGAQEIQQVVSSMQGIGEGARQIESIITTIDGIAFQTNILALNAAVEAARAGEQGRGFAVVASEVRALAQRSAASAREIKALIQQSNARVGEGARVVDAAGRTMQDTEAAIRRVNGLMQQIAEASAEQAGGIGQVGQTITQMDTATQQNAALVEEATAAARSMAEQAAALAELTARFTLRRDSGPAH
jgi:methyl-accepting chemotaxis protein